MAVVDPLPPTEGPDSELDSLLARCLEAPSVERDAVVDQFCRERPELASELRSRLRLLADVGLTEASEAAATIPERLGDFRLLQHLGSGGMGVVYAAVQESLGREVALKLIRPEHLFFPGARERFRREVLAAAQLEHPGIVRVHLVDEQDGIPFFAMDRVRGCSAADLIARLRGTPPEQLDGRRLAEALAAPGDRTHPPSDLGDSWTQCAFGLVLQAARALVHAHGKGIVHRDVKPSNLMVTPEGRVLVVDFGLSSREGSTKLTRAGAVMGSLAYMSPEQVRGEHTGARTDVYSLGLVLYELLTLREAFFGEGTEQLRAAILAARPAPVRAFNRRVPIDAETVVLAAIAPEPSRRYQTMAAFADDLAAILAHRPIAARRPGPWLRARRFVQRHPTATAAATLGAALLLGVPTVWLVQEKRAAAVIRDQRDTAQEALQFMVGLFEQADPRSSRGKDVTARELLDAGARNVRQGLAHRPAVRNSLLKAMGSAFSGLSMWRESRALLEEYIESQERLSGVNHATLDARQQLAMVLYGSGQAEAGLELATRALAMRRKLAPDDHEGLARAHVTVAAGHGSLGRAAAAEAPLREALRLFRLAPGTPPLRIADTMARIAEVCTETGRTAEAEPLAEEAIAIAEADGRQDHSVTVATRYVLGRVRLSAGKAAQAVDALTQALAGGERIYAADDPWLAKVLEAHSLARWELGEHDGAFADIERALAIRRAEDGRGLPLCLNQLATFHLRRGDLDQAEAVYRENLQASERIMGASHQITAMVRANLGRCLAAAQDLAGAADEFAAAAAIYESAIGDHLATVQTMDDLARAKLGTGDLAGAEAAQARALAMMERAHPGDHVVTARLLDTRGRVRTGLRRTDEALDDLRRAVDMLARLGEAHDLERGRVLQPLAEALVAKGDLAAALEAIDQAVAVLRGLAVPDPHELATALAIEGDVHRRRRDLPAAVTAFEEARDLLLRLAPDHPDLESVLQPLLELHAELGDKEAHAAVLRSLERLGKGR
jgi:serine/threonine protein kinase